MVTIPPIARLRAALRIAREPYTICEDCGDCNPTRSGACPERLAADSEARKAIDEALRETAQEEETSKEVRWIGRGIPNKAVVDAIVDMMEEEDAK